MFSMSTSDMTKRCIGNRVKKDQNPAIIIIIIITIIISSCHHSQWRSCRKGQSLDRSLPTGQTARGQGLPAIIYTQGEEL